MSQRAPSVSSKSARKKRAVFGKALTYIVLSLWALVCLFPLYWLAVTSLKGASEIMGGPFYLPFVDFVPSLEAWAFVLLDSNQNLVLQYFNSVVAGLTSTLLTLFLGAFAAYGLTRFRYTLPWTGLALGLLAAVLTASAIFVGASWLRFFFAILSVLLLVLATRLKTREPALHNHSILVAILATRILPPIVLVVPIFLMAQYTGTLDTLFALIFTYTATNLPVAVWLLLPIFAGIAIDHEEAAQLDGASRLRIFFTIFLPMVAGGIAAVGVLIFILCWTEYLFSAYLAGNPATTLPAWVVGQMSVREAQVGGDADEWAHLSAAILLMIAPLLACTVLAQRFLGRMVLRRQ